MQISIHIHKHLSYNWWGFQAWDTLQDSTDNSSIDKAETGLDWQEYFSQLQDTTNVLPCDIHLPVCLWIIDPHSRAPKKNTSHGNEVLHKILHISYKDHVTNQEVCAKIQQARGPHEDLQTIVKRCKLQWYGHVSHLSVWPKPSWKAQWRGEEDKADRGRGGKTTSGNGQAWDSPSPRTENWRKLVAKSSVVPQRPSRLKDWWW